MRDLQFVQETWLPCPGFETSYEVSNYGKVRSIDRYISGRNGLVKGKLILQGKNKKGYPEVRLWKNNKQEARNPHRLVAQAFIPNPDNKPQVNHIDGNKENNSIDNLEWVSNSDNQLHAYKLGLQPSRSGENNNKAKITNKQVDLIKLDYNYGLSISIIADSYKISIEIIRNIIYGRTWRSNTTPIIRRDERFKNQKLNTL